MEWFTEIISYGSFMTDPIAYFIMLIIAILLLQHAFKTDLLSLRKKNSDISLSEILIILVSTVAPPLGIIIILIIMLMKRFAGDSGKDSLFKRVVYKITTKIIKWIKYVENIEDEKPKKRRTR